MNYAIIDGTTVKSTGTIQQLFPNTSFSIGGPNADFLTENNVVELVENLSYITPTQKLSNVDAYVQDGKAYNVRVENTTAEEQIALTDEKWIAIRLERDRRLQITDWRASSDLKLSDDWKNYRNELRQIPQTQTDPYNIAWPTEPSS
tara:strand:- start:103 stop:543 length:441 start_codon:yes stop_codon:yes gene_type:complete